MTLSSRDVGKLGEIATLFEVSGYPKPGNVHRTQNFDDMYYEDFLISSVCIGEHIENVVYKAQKYSPYFLNKINMGKDILGCVESANKLTNTNTNLGTSMLIIPIAATYATLTQEDSLNKIANTMDLLLRNTGEDDAIALIKAIILSKAGGMEGKTTQYDANNKNTINDIIENKVNMYKLLEISSKYDKISYELTNQLPVITTIGTPTFLKTINEYSINDTTLQTYLTILSKTPDTLITRKYGEEIAQTISDKATTILEDTEVASKKRLDSLNEFDKYLRSKKYNPGTTADFTAASIFMGLLYKYSESGI
ncbi:MAG: hypothetical protein BZ136_02500 [Methanosphaera sp. rholeuAM74]|nr:MAG: hypothetical protein BZ136_02500 [Methanosphaera sp. rholeuAM74]